MLLHNKAVYELALSKTKWVKTNAFALFVVKHMHSRE